MRVLAMSTGNITVAAKPPAAAACKIVARIVGASIVFAGNGIAWSEQHSREMT